MLTIDGSRGEGGGQILRSALTLSVLTGEPVHVHGIRAGRAKPGLLRQHLTAARAAAEISGGQLDGDALGSSSLVLRPGPVQPQTYTFDIGTAGATTLVLQTVLLPLLLAGARSKLKIDGGTHNPAAPPARFVEASFLPALARLGGAASIELVRWGFYPAGGGRIIVDVEPSRLQPAAFTTRGPIRGWRVRAAVSALPTSIGAREVTPVCQGLALPKGVAKVLEVPDPRGPGNLAWVEADHDAGTTVITAFGEKGVRAEEVARRLVDATAAWRDLDVPVDEHLADQLLLPMAWAGGGELVTGPPSLHLRTNADLIRAVVGTPIGAVEEAGRWRVVVGPEAARLPPLGLD